MYLFQQNFERRARMGVGEWGRNLPRFAPEAWTRQPVRHPLTTSTEVLSARVVGHACYNILQRMNGQMAVSHAGELVCSPRRMPPKALCGRQGVEFGVWQEDIATRSGHLCTSNMRFMRAPCISPFNARRRSNSSRLPCAAALCKAEAMLGVPGPCKRATNETKQQPSSTVY